MDVLDISWFIIQIFVGFNLIWPLLLYVFWVLFRRKSRLVVKQTTLEPDYAVIITAYEQIENIPFVVSSVLAADYQNYIIYVVADKCDVSALSFTDQRVVILRPPRVLSSNTASHEYAFENFARAHQHITILDSDNLVHPDYFRQLNLTFSEGFEAVQGIRHAKNLNTTVARLDAARDIYYHFYDGILLYETGSSATLSGSGMAFQTKLYEDFLTRNSVKGAGFDKVLQHFIVKKGLRIAFNRHAIVYDEKTSKEAQLVNQRSRWINTWFKYFKLGFDLVFKGIFTFSLNRLLFGITLLRPPLFIFLILSVFCFVINLLISPFLALFWLIGLCIFVGGFIIALRYSNADPEIYTSLRNIPNFVYLQIKSLLKSPGANKRSVATKHYVNSNSENIDSDENGSKD
ncbi:glycosyltransferase [Pedobacter faecalis]|uniref:glycosyltransferase n=1 Tax=Pedobacter faecalis TaxID=3041495 RepID=UPI00254A6B42|nr:glycosyltransferase [Pedobacter sp. ELA7]